MEPIIEFKDYSFRYRSQTEPTVQDINLRIMPGEKVLIAGPSGSGKSTLAHTINALIPCSFPGETAGTLRVCGKDPQQEGVFGMSKLVGTVLQDTDGQFIGLTVAEDLAFALENDAVPQEQLKKRVDEIAGIVNLKDLLHHAPGELSGGQKQRVSMGGVLADDVKILLFDEPLANLDPATGKKTIALIDRILKEEDLTVVIIEHRLEDVLYRDVDRIVVIGEGRIVCDLPPDELLSTDILKEQGIREPLYVSALGYAGVTLRPEDHPQHIESMELAPYAESVRKWFTAAPAKAVPVSDAPALEVRNLNFSYTPGEPVLRGVSFRLNRGEMVALVGRNGAGKSTLASLICGFVKPDSGEILLGGKDISPLSIKERGEHVGLVMQSPNQTLKICGLWPFRNWPVSALSFGQKKRVTIASILVMDPEILILDEPTAGQDYRHYTEIMEFLRRINRETGITILMITHDMHLMLEYTDRALVVADGTLLADKTPSAVLTDEALTEAADLKKTSLYDLAVRCGIEPPSEFVDRFIAYEREHMRRAEQEGGAQ